MEKDNKLRISLAAARVNAQMTQEDVCKQLHITKATLINWEKGKVKPSIATFKTLCVIYGLAEDDIFLPK